MMKRMRRFDKANWGYIKCTHQYITNEERIAEEWELDQSHIWEIGEQYQRTNLGKL